MMPTTQTGLHSVPLFDKATGIVNSIDPMRVGEGGVVTAENVVIDISGAIRRRDGMERLSSATCHSLFSCGSYGLGVFGGVLSLIERNLTVSSLVSVGSAKVNYALWFNGMYDVVFFSNGTVIGKVVNKAYSAWVTGSYVGLDSTDSRIDEYLSAPPIGQLLKIHNGRMYVAVENLVYVSEIFDYSRFKFIPFIFENDIVMMEGVAGGLYVGDESDLFFLGGSSPEEFTRTKVMSGRVVTDSCVKVAASDIGLQGAKEVIVFTVAGEGICIGSESGCIQNLTGNDIDFSNGLIGAACVTKDKQYIVSMGE